MRGRKIVAATAIGLSTALLAACGGDDSDDAADDGTVSGSVSMWIYPVIADDATHQAFWDEKVAAFAEEFPDVDVSVEIFPWAERDQALTTAIAGNSAPDVVYLIPDQLPGYARNLEPVDDYLSDEAKDDYLDNAVESVSIDGQMMGAPILSSVIPLVCNKQVFDAVGVTEYPSTWDDILELGPTFKDAGYYVTTYGGDVAGSLNLSFYPLLWQAGGDVYNDDGTEVAFNSDEGVRALEFVQQLVENGFVPEDRLITEPPIEQTQFAQGRVACTMHVEPQHLTAFWGEENTVVLPPLTESEQVAYGTVGSLSMLSSAEDKDAAGAWIEFATGAESAAEYDTEGSFFTTKESVGALYEGDPIFGESEKYTGLATVGPLVESAREVMGVLAPEIQSVLIGEKEPQQALDDAAEAAQPLLG
ncbi:ABC transporter substrate-binding protein [Jiangella mangrovi]|uniref:Multiple sugar transport system substrate-binding protein n=1 Tax=Jiangella mangrovi TaxID=1524084 RepID=A0A7W9GW08_9ACTN|nr:sugar ABC transporter substrate-binding protein [Jiangella mangrovi]MBB5790701.1 multiple sugar transport system substrate-binding protein [Jiangella mangrovi]